MLGRLYADGEVVFRQGDVGDCAYVVQQGHVEIVREHEGRATILATLGAGEFFGEMALFEREVRSATVRAAGPSRILTVDKRTLLRRIQEDPSLAFSILERMSRRLREANSRLMQLKEEG